MKILHHKLSLKPARLLLMCLTMLNFTNTANATAPTELPPPDAGHLVITGSVTLSNLMTYWIQAFAEQNPSITINIADPGGIAGIDALINGSADMVLTSIHISDKEKEAFEQHYGYTPRIIPVAMDAVVIYVNGLNPIKSISLIT